MKNSILLLILMLNICWVDIAGAEEIGCFTTTWKLIGANAKICVQAFDDPKVKGVACHISQARTGGISGAVGVAEDPASFSISCRQIGPIELPKGLPKEDTVFSEGTDLFFKETKVNRLVDSKRNVLVYVAISRKIIKGSSANSISTVPIMPWPRQ